MMCTIRCLNESPSKEHKKPKKHPTWKSSLYCKNRIKVKLFNSLFTPCKDLPPPLSFPDRYTCKKRWTSLKKVLAPPLGHVWAMRGFCTLRIFIFAVERNLIFLVSYILPLPWEIEILSKKISSFFLFFTRKMCKVNCQKN